MVLHREMHEDKEDAGHCTQHREQSLGRHAPVGKRAGDHRRNECRNTAREDGISDEILQPVGSEHIGKWHGIGGHRCGMQEEQDAQREAPFHVRLSGKFGRWRRIGIL